MKKVMTVFELKHGCTVIVMIGMLIAAAAFICLILFTLIETILIHVQNYKANQTVRTGILVLVLANSIMLVIANGYLLVGTYSDRRAAYELSAYLLFIMITIDIFLVAFVPTACLYSLADACTIIQESSHYVHFVILFGMMIHLDLWAYYMSCIFSASKYLDL